MNVTELMIGDWVYDTILQSNAKIQAINPLTIRCDIHTEHHLYCEFNPIHLTPEILENNGFSPETFLTSEWEKEVYFKEFSSCVVEPDDSGKYIFGTTIYWNKTDGDGSPIDWGTMYDSRICNLQYVHELQQALRLVGLNELADNFKV